MYENYDIIKAAFSSLREELLRHRAIVGLHSSHLPQDYLPIDLYLVKINKAEGFILEIYEKFLKKENKKWKFVLVLCLILVRLVS